MFVDSFLSTRVDMFDKDELYKYTAQYIWYLYRRIVCYTIKIPKHEPAWSN